LNDDKLFIARNSVKDKAKVIGGEVDEKEKKEIEEGGRQARKKARQERAKQNVSVRKARKVNVDNVEEEEEKQPEPAISDNSDSSDSEGQKEFVKICGQNLDPKWKARVICHQCNGNSFNQRGDMKGGSRQQNKELAKGFTKGEF